METLVYHYVYRLLANEGSEPGFACATVVNFYLGQNLSEDEETRQSPTISDVLKVSQAICSTVEDHVQGDKGSALPGSWTEMEPWLQASVERYLFSRIGAHVWRLYIVAHRSEDDACVAKAEIMRRLGTATLFSNLEVREHFRGQVAACSIDGGRLGCPYQRASTALSNLGYALSGGGCSPHEAVRMLLAAQIDMKTCALEACLGACELVAMDDIVPLFLFVLVQSNLHCPFAAAAFMSDSLTSDERFGSEGRAVVLLEAAARFITNEWCDPSLRQAPSSLLVVAGTQCCKESGALCGSAQIPADIASS